MGIAKTMRWMALMGALIATPAKAHPAVHHRKRVYVRRAKHPVSGMVSWYGTKFVGRRMANGQRYDPKKLTAASRTYHLGTRLRLFCKHTGKSVVVTVTDRGPQIRSRILDISEAAAKSLGIKNLGTSMVQIHQV